MVLSLSHPLGGQVKLAGNPIKMDGLTEEEKIRGVRGYAESKGIDMSKRIQVGQWDPKEELEKERKEGERRLLQKKKEEEKKESD